IGEERKSSNAGNKWPPLGARTLFLPKRQGGRWASFIGRSFPKNEPMISLTALVLTYNEQDNIRRNLEALVWVPKVIIVDSFSNDGTLEIVRSFANVQVVQRVFDTHANQWN